MPDVFEAAAVVLAFALGVVAGVWAATGRQRRAFVRQARRIARSQTTSVMSRRAIDELSGRARPSDPPEH